MEEQFTRTALLLGESAVEKLKNSSVLLFGVGGVGGYAAEALARAGIGKITLVDKDTVSESNINRQIIALHSTVGREKAEVMKERITDINPACIAEAKNCFFGEDNADDFDFSSYSYVVDAVDDVKAKSLIIERAKSAGVPVISAMGAGNKLNPTDFEAADISETSVCPLAKVVRKKLKERGITGVKAVYSKEIPVKHTSPVGSVSFVPPAMGLIIAEQVIKELIS